MRSYNIGLTTEQRQSVIQLLNQDLANLSLLVIKTKKYHWDVVGPQFMTLHHLWEEHYETLTKNVDACAERIRALGGYPLGTAKGFLDNSTLNEHPGDLPTATDMVACLVSDHEQVIRNLREHIDQCSEQFHDEGTADFFTGLMKEQEEMSWMLRSFIEGEQVDSSGSRSGFGLDASVQ